MCIYTQQVVAAMIFTLQIVTGNDGLWESWWDYKGISGPHFWGYINPEWTMCSKGRNQSPINVDPSSLLFDPSLSPLDIVGDMLTGTIKNNGHDLTFNVHKTEGDDAGGAGVYIKGGPLSYSYQVDQIKFHFGHRNDQGSEHSVHFSFFPVEIQVLAYNSDLYPGYAEAESSVFGLAVISVFVQISDIAHREFTILQDTFNSTLYKGDSASIERLRLGHFIPTTDHYMTYEGSTTFPPCHETVTWIIYNRPVYISQVQLHSLRRLRQGTRKNPMAPMAGNFRSTQLLNRRTVRTNINTRKKKCKGIHGTSYTVNELFTDRNVPR